MLKKLINPALRDALLAGMVVLAVSSAIGYFVYRSAEKGLTQEVQNYISNLAASASQFTEGDLHQQITKPEDQGNETYEQLRAPYFKLLRANPAIAYIYTVIEQGDHIFFILDASIPKPGEKQDNSAVMEQYDDATDTMKQALAQRKALVESESYTDNWGTFLSAYAPFYNSKGEFVGIVGADIRLEDFNARLAKIHDTFLIGLVIALIASVIVGIAVWYARNAALQSEARNHEQQIQLAAMEKSRIEQQERDKEEAERTKRETLESMAVTFETSVQGVVAQVAVSSAEISEGLTSIAAIAVDTNDRSSTVGSSSVEAAQMSSHVAAAAEELTASVQEISVQTQRSRNVAQDATKTAQEVRSSIEALVEKANRVGEIITVITGIAKQINLLALNATIESARAGEAGRGFAVVASEVKNLANQVGSATDAITQQIDEIQSATNYSADAVMHIIEIINEVSEGASSVAAAVEEQSAVTREIAVSISRASEGVQRISSEIQNVQTGADQVQSTTHQVLHSADTLSTQSALLREKVDAFLAAIRA